MESYISVIHFQCLTALNQPQFPLFHLHQKNCRSIKEIPDKLYLFEQKDRIEYLHNIQSKIKPADIINISFIMYKYNKKLIIQSTDVLVHSAIAKF